MIQMFSDTKITHPYDCMLLSNESIRPHTDKQVENRFVEDPTLRHRNPRLPARGPKILHMILLIKVLVIFNMIIFLPSE